MENFERIKKLCAEAATSNVKNTCIIKQWKYDIRQCLMRIRTNFNNNIDRFIDQFSKLFKNIEQCDELREY